MKHKIKSKTTKKGPKILTETNCKCQKIRAKDFIYFSHFKQINQFTKSDVHAGLIINFISFDKCATVQKHNLSSSHIWYRKPNK